MVSSLTERYGALAARALIGLLVLWAGILIGVSFLASPAKFAAPSLTLPVALDVGRHVFGTLNGVEIGLAVLALALALVARPPRAVWAPLVIVWLVVALQTLWLLPVLDARTTQVIAGQTPAPAPWHGLYVALEITELLALLAGAALATRPARRTRPAQRTR